MRAPHLALLVLAFSPDAGAQACCSGSSANEFGVVARGNRALVGMRFTQEAEVWSVDGDGRASRLESSFVSNSIFTLGGGLRVLSEHLQIQGALPVRLQHHRFGDLTQTGHGLGDASLNLRSALVEDDSVGLFDGGGFVPFVEPYVGARFPTGRPPSRGETATSADVTGRGDFQGLAGLRLSRFLTDRDVLFVGGSFGHSLHTKVERGGVEHRHQRGNELNGHVSYFRYQTLLWAIGAAVDYQVVTNAAEDGVVVPHSTARRLTLGAQVSRYFSWPSWQVRLAFTLDPPIDGVGRNLPFTGFGASLGLERHFGYPSDY